MEVGSEAKPFTIDSFYEFLAQGKLMGARCRACGRLMVPPRPLCPDCYSDDLEWVELRGEGTVEAYTVIHVAPAKLAEEAPYIVALVRLDEGPVIPGRLRGVEPEHIEVGLRVKLEVEQPRPEGGWPTWPNYYFRPA